MSDPWIYTPPKLVPAPASFDRSQVPPRSRFRVLGALPPQRVQAPEVAKLVVGAGAALMAFWHGYKRNGGSVPWGILWAGAGFWCPVVTIPFAWSQGFGKRA